VKSSRKIVQALARIAVCLALVAWILHVIFTGEARAQWDLDDGRDWAALSRAEQWRASWSLGPVGLWKTISGVQYGMLALSLGFMGSTLFIGMLRWRMVLSVQGLALPLVRTAEISLVAHFFNSFMLGSTGGDLLKAYYVARETRHKKAEAVVTVVADRLIGLFTMLMFSGLMALANFRLLAANPRFMAVAGLAAVMLASCGLVVALAFWGGPKKWQGCLRQVVRRFPKGESLERALEACRRFGGCPNFLMKALGLSVLLSLACVMQIMTLGWGLGLEMERHWQVMLWMVPAIICVAALPVTPSGLGVRENLYVLLLAAPVIGFGQKEALSLSLLAFAGSLAWSLVGGLVYLVLKESHNLAETAEESG